MGIESSVAHPVAHSVAHLQKESPSMGIEREATMLSIVFLQRKLAKRVPKHGD